jgi:site-specific recombinase XerD
LEKAGIADFHFHDLRHCAATDLWRLGVEQMGIKKTLGHSKITTSELYVNLGDADLREGLQRLGNKYSDYLM